MGLTNVKNYFDEKQAEKKLADFLKNNEVEINVFMRDYVAIFNDCGEKTASEPVQVGFFSSIVLLMAKTSKIPKSQILQAFKNLERKL